MYIFIGICPLLATVNLNKVWASAFSPVAILIFGWMYLLKYDCWSSVTSLLESNKDGIWIPWALMHTLGHLATAHCIISIFVSAKMKALLSWQIKSPFPHNWYEDHFSSLLWFGLWPKEVLASSNFGSQSESLFSGCQFSWASLLFNLIQFSFK